MRADCDFLEYAIKTFDKTPEFMKCRKIPFDLLQSPYVNMIERTRTLEPECALAEMEDMFIAVESHSAELTLQALAISLTRTAENLRYM
ncbi:unnamed protein product [Strongylus vulgaris]|uniref:Uncharacterized protein n=1 Tax=Strongylus vulgaris TaxID=40348 RepID=A0A3P7KHN1_STRVU|nr:unnamed protein product [Strongylus vulgaris]